MKSLRVAFLALLASALLIIGCPLDRIGAGQNINDMDKTPAGWRVEWHDKGTLSTGLHTKADLYALFDAAVQRAAAEYAAKYNRPASEYLSRLRRIEPGFTLIDDFMFPVAGRPLDFPDAAYASGETQGPSVTLAFWAKASSPLAADPAAPPWTVRQGASGTWYWGWEGAVGGLQYPAIEYETMVNLMGLPW